MNRMVTLMGFLAAAATCATAQSFDSYYVKANLIRPQGDMLTQTRAKLGYGAEIGAVFTLPEASGLDVGLHAEYLVVSRKKLVDETFTTKGTSVGLDVRYHLPSNFMIIAGPVLTTWDITGSKRGSAGENAPKLGYRGGLQYAFRKEMAVGITYTFSEWQSNRLNPRENGINPSHPSYLSFSFLYKF